MPVTAGPIYPGIKDGLVFAIDPANKDSYPGTGTICTDFKGSLTGSFISSPSFSQTSGSGMFVFDGTSGRAIKWDSSISLTPYCISVWIYNDDDITTSIIDGPYQEIFGFDAYPGGFSLGAWTSRATNETICFWAGSNTEGMTYIRDTVSAGYHNIVVNWNSEEDKYDFYVDGVEKTTYPDSNYGNAPLTARSNKSLELGRDLGGSHGYDFDGKIGPLLIYGSELTSNQVVENYNRLKGRFGLS